MGKPHTKSVNKYIKNNYDRIAVLLKKGDKEIVKKLAAARGMSVNAYIKSLLDIEINRYKSRARLRMHMPAKKKPPID
ncbi:MAG: hypothetical protein NC253_15410 [Ruminococcus sp.]|nr:hypothetical protein [Ruminococcus sp.]MCM1480490.1 hypothetical protein [Muribaculaceae bacterium]